MNIPQLDSTYIANTYARFPVTIARGKGSLVWDADDKVYIDMATGIAVNSSAINALRRGRLICRASPSTVAASPTPRGSAP